MHCIHILLLLCDCLVVSTTTTTTTTKTTKTTTTKQQHQPLLLLWEVGSDALLCLVSSLFPLNEVKALLMINFHN